MTRDKDSREDIEGVGQLVADGTGALDYGGPPVACRRTEC
jgi:hypothetical protein